MHKLVVMHERKSFQELVRDLSSLRLAHRFRVVIRQMVLQASEGQVFHSDGEKALVLEPPKGFDKAVLVLLAHVSNRP